MQEFNSLCFHILLHKPCACFKIFRDGHDFRDPPENGEADAKEGVSRQMQRRVSHGRDCLKNFIRDFGLFDDRVSKLHALYVR